MEPDPKRAFLEALARSLREGTFAELVVGKYRGPSGMARVAVRRVVLARGERLCFRIRHADHEETRNLSPEEASGWLERRLGDEYRSAVLRTTREDLHLEFNRRRQATLSRSRPSLREVPSAAHDRSKHRLLGPESSVYLAPLGLVTADGRPRERMAHKLRQVEKFLEILDASIRESELRPRGALSLVDMGAGKGYLTFAAYDHLSRDRAVSITAVEARPALAQAGNRLAARVGFEGLRFVAGSIDQVDLAGVDVLVALHACDTATDDALYRGIAAGASVILCAPCCHKEIRSQLRPPLGLERGLGHGILLERQAEIVTDGLRALLLERSGYATKVFEFVSGEHTAKNVMIAAVRRRSGPIAAAAQREIEALKALYGVRSQRLETLLEGLGAGGRR